MTSALVFLAALALQAGDTLRVGNPLLDPSRIPLGTDTIFSYRVTDSVREPTSRTIQRISLDTLAGTAVLSIVSRHVSPDGAVTDGTITVRASDLALLRHEVVAESDSMAAAVSAGHATGWVVLPGTEPMLFDVALDHHVLPVDGPHPWLPSALPLSQAMRVVVPRFSPWSVAERWHSYRVTGREPVLVEGEEVICWIVDAGPLGPPGYRATIWVSVEGRRIVRGALRGAAEGQVEYWSYLGPAPSGG